MRKITHHKNNKLNSGIEVTSNDERGTSYTLSAVNKPRGARHTGTPLSFNIRFQDGPTRKAGRNGLTTASLLAVLIDRTRVVQKRASSRERALAITKLEEALLWLNKGTADKVAVAA